MNPLSASANALPLALKHLLDPFRDIQDGPTFVEEIDEDIRLDDFGSLQLYRIAQEAITNAIHHGKPDTITLTLQKEPELQLVFEDNGSGFDPGTPSAKSSDLRLDNMRKRAEVANLCLNISSVPSEDTRIQCTVLKENGHESA